MAHCKLNNLLTVWHKADLGEGGELDPRIQGLGQDSGEWSEVVGI